MDTVEDTGIYTVHVAAAARESEANLFRDDLDKAGLSKCHGILHASGCRNVSDLSKLTSSQITSLDTNASDVAIIRRMSEDGGNNEYSIEPISNAKLSTTVDDGVYIADKKFNFEVICAENEVYKGRLFTIDQCNQLKRMSEYQAYKVNSAWQGMSCKSIPRFIPTTDEIFCKLFREFYTLYPGSIQGSIQFESDSEPHLVKYNGEAKGAPIHIDTSHKSITMNVLLSDPDDFGGGGTYLKVIDKTIKLEQGEMLIHPGQLEHSGTDITFGVRQLLVAFVKGEWENTEHIEGQVYSS